MSGEDDKERQRALDEVAAHGWTAVEVNPRTGYTKLHCGCGQHKAWLPKTPSSPYTYRNKAKHMIRVCSIPG